MDILSKHASMKRATLMISSCHMKSFHSATCTMASQGAMADLRIQLSIWKAC